MKNTDKKIKKYISQFPNNAINWSQATDEIRDLAYLVRSAYNELIIDVIEGDAGYVESLNFRAFKTPAEWNTKAKNQITELWSKLNDYAKQSVIESL